MSLKPMVKYATAVLLVFTFLAPSVMAATPRARKTHERPARRGVNAKPARMRNVAVVPVKAAKAAPFDDCDICHDNCLAGSLACIAISAITACAPCGVVCLAAQLVCQTNCNKTTACKGTGTVGTEESAN